MDFSSGTHRYTLPCPQGKPGPITMQWRYIWTIGFDNSRKVCCKNE